MENRKNGKNVLKPAAISAAMIMAALVGAGRGSMTALGQESVPVEESASAQENASAQAGASTAQLTEADIQALNGGQASIFSHDGRLTLVEGTCTEEPVRSMEEAAAVIDTLSELLGGGGQIELMPHRQIEDAAGNQYYVFQQMAGDTTVCGGAVKLITDGEGQMKALSASVVADLPETEASAGITAEEAQQVVLSHSREIGRGSLTLVEGATEKIVLPLVLDVDDDDNESSRYVWVVYTDQTGQIEDKVINESSLPYLAHYVTMDGEYLYSLPTIMPGDEAGDTGFDAGYVFEFMEPASYTGYVDLADGTEQELTVTVMRDRRTGMYYLGDPERRIVVADCYEFLYNHGTVVLESSPDNREWDQTALLSLYNYSRVWDYYQEIGWTGGDGNGTPILILNDYRDEDHIQVDNAAFAGNYLGWSLFVSSRINAYAQCPDVIAHEFTHCVTSAVMTYNAYMNDYGAINEALSDIQGEICEQMLEGRTADDWLMGDNSGESIRSMSEPGLYQQPAYTWDLYYTPNVQVPTILNDEGGVHSNSSLLNQVAYELCTSGGMTLEEARAFWFAVDCAMVPGTDYRQLAELLPAALRMQGMDNYLSALETALEDTALGVDTLPESFQSDQVLLTLTLPDEEIFRDGSWALQVFSLDAGGFRQRLHEIVEQIRKEDFSFLPSFLLDLIHGDLDETEGEAADLFSIDWKEEIRQWILTTFRDYYFSGMGSAGLDGRTIRMVCRPGRCLPVLMHMVFTDDSQQPEQAVMAFYFNGKWYPVQMQDMLADEEDGKDDAHDGSAEEDAALLAMGEVVDELSNALTDRFLGKTDRGEFIGMFFPELSAGETVTLPADGLDEITVPEGRMNIFLDEDTEEVPVKMSRPKEETA